MYGIRILRMFHPVNSFMDMARQTNENSKKNKGGKKIYLSDIEKSKVPKYLSDLLKYMSEGSHTLKNYPRNFAPGYVTKINTKKEVTRNKYSLNHYTDFYKIPNKPTQNGTARGPSLHRGLSQILNIKRLRLNLSSSLETTGLWLLRECVYPVMITISLSVVVSTQESLFQHSITITIISGHTVIQLFYQQVNDAEGTPSDWCFSFRRRV